MPRRSIVLYSQRIFQQRDLPAVGLAVVRRINRSRTRQSTHCSRPIGSLRKSTGLRLHLVYHSSWRLLRESSARFSGNNRSCPTDANDTLASLEVRHARRRDTLFKFDGYARSRTEMQGRTNHRFEYFIGNCRQFTLVLSRVEANAQFCSSTGRE